MTVLLPIVAFVSGAVVMILELAAARIVAPYLGTSAIVWTSVIGVILAALSLGYWAGGKLADRSPSLYTLSGVLLAASGAIAFASYFQWILRFVADFSDIQSAAVSGVLVLFGPATFLLGMVTPLAVKLLLTDMTKTGRTVGNLYAISNTGSIIGTFLGGFVLISFFGNSKIVGALSLTMLALALVVGAFGRFRIRTTAVAVAIIGIGGMFVPSGLVLSEGETLIADVDTNYSRTWIYDTGEPIVRVMTNALGAAQSAQLVDDPDQIVFTYIRFFDAHGAFVDNPARALMIGGSAYTYPRHFLQTNPESAMTVVEIDPSVTELARTYFGLADDPRLEIVHADGRTFLNQSDDEYDVIFIDAFNSDTSIPFHLTTKEAVARISTNLADDGVVLVNILAALEGPRSGFLAAEYATYASVFPYVALHKIQDYELELSQNIMLIASKQPLVPDPSHEFAATLSATKWNAELAPQLLLTDDYAPVEWYTNL